MKNCLDSLCKKDGSKTIKIRVKMRVNKVAHIVQELLNNTRTKLKLFMVVKKELNNIFENLKY